jgi:AcrR family transcriptional regulator
VDEVQRRRILETMAEVLAERGAAGASMREVISRSGASSGAFHEVFADREACLLAAFDLAVERARTRMASAYDLHSRWLDSVKAALAQFLGFLEDEPALGRLLVVYSLSGGEQVLRRRVQVLAALAAVVDLGRLEGSPGRQQPPAVVAEGVVGAVLAVLQNRLVAGEPEGVMDLFGSLVSIIVLPYMGAGVARRELARPAPRARSASRLIGGQDVGSPEYSAGTRLTYRTARVLGAIGDYPGASNREVADRAGIVDQGQVSKLLGRLQARGLIAKMDAGRTRGAPNAWTLTERGELVLGDVTAVPR